MDVIIFHGKCPDGWCAAFIAHKRYPEAELLPMDHGEPLLLKQVVDKDVLVVDFSWPLREDNILLYNSARSFRILDHHKTAEECLRDLDFVTFDMTRSGAGLAWDYLFGKDKPESDRPHWFNRETGEVLGPVKEVPQYEERPWYVDYVEDRDLWNWALPNSKEVNAYLMSLPMTTEGWDILDLMMAGDAAIQGQGILRNIDRYVREAVAEAQWGVWPIDYPIQDSMVKHHFYTVQIVNAPYMNCSEVGHVLAQKTEVGMTWFERADGQIQFSLRSIGDIDVSRIAKNFNGGGHQHAAGFRMSLKDGRDLIDHILGRDVLSI